MAMFEWVECLAEQSAIVSLFALLLLESMLCETHDNTDDLGPNLFNLIAIKSIAKNLKGYCYREMETYRLI